MPSTAPEESTWDLAIARRPDVNDCGGACLVNDTSEGGKNLPPTDGTYPEATWLNQDQKQIAALAAVAPSARLTVAVPAGVPGIVALMAPGATVLVGDFTVTDMAVGAVEISWPSGKLPLMTCDPTVTVNAHGDNSATATIVSATRIRIETRTAGALADLRFTVEIH